jgi:uncharacterized protein YdgA (DUF945 family)
VKNPAAGAVLISAFALALPASAQDAPAPAAPAAPQLFDPALLKLYADMMKDLRPLISHRATLKQKVELTRNFSFSPDTRAELQSAFGNDNPLHISVEDLPAGGAAIHVLTDALDHTDAKNGGTMHVGAATAESIVNSDYTAVKTNLAMGDLKLTAPGGPGVFEMNNLTLAGDNKVGPSNFFVGKTGGKIGHVRAGISDSFMLDIDDMNFTADVAARKKMFDVSYDYRIASVGWGGDKLENFHTDIAITNIDVQALEKLADFGESVDAGRQADAEQMNQVVRMFKDLAVDFSRHNGAIELRDVSAQYHGQTAGLSGRITLSGIRQSDLQSTQKVYEKLALRLRLHVPTAMIDDISHRVARAVMEAQAKANGGEVTDMAIDLVARGMVGKITDTLVKEQKWAHMEKDELVAVLELKKGKMYLDGHAVNAKSNPFLAMARGK